MSNREDYQIKLVDDGKYLCLFNKSGNLMYKRMDDADIKALIEGATYGNHRESGHQQSQKSDRHRKKIK